MKYYRLLEQRGADAWENTIVTNSQKAREEMESWLDTHTDLEINKLDYLYVAVYDTMAEAEDAYCDHDIAFEYIDGEIKDVRDGEAKEYYEYNDMYCIKGTVNSFEDFDNMVEFADDRCWKLTEIETPDGVSDDMLVW